MANGGNRPGRVHDRELLDALDALDGVAFAGDVWRVTRTGRDVSRGSNANGRWSPPGEFEAVYTSLDRDGALAEVGHRLSLEPVWPSRIEHTLHRIDLHLDRTLRLADLSRLADLGVDSGRYGSYDYRVTQAVASAAHFLEFDGLMVPSARYGGGNMVIFPDRIGPGYRFEVLETEPVDWSAWRKRPE